MSLFDTTIARVAGVTPDSAAAQPLKTRDSVIRMSQAAEDAVLRPRDTGAFGHDLRAALAARIARLGGDEELAEHYRAQAGNQAALADPTATGDAEGLSGVLAFVDKVANQTRDVAAQDVAALRAAGISDADIVRLCELIAFMAYQLRVIDGLRLMRGARA